ncbi:nitric oxide synthase, endothelial-like [Lytechinus variegatus]|uniref:nitric oxide synthase, endothelial-like n=1 Tax=Lytechinus variegatus TaxID=7654 RepID=UPI001BB186FC|nr:nitric oxide synthase, endothelial-like [Lytechinus variegatus]
MDQEEIDDGLAPHEMVNGLGDDLGLISVDDGLECENTGEEEVRTDDHDDDIADGGEKEDSEPESEKQPTDQQADSTTSSSLSFDTTPALMSTTPGRFVSLWLPNDTTETEKPDKPLPSSSLTVRRPLERSPSKKKDTVVLLNHLDGSEFTDTLHSQAIEQETTNLSRDGKADSVTSPTRQKPPPRSQDEKIRLAREFIDQYYAHAQRSGTVSHERRLYEVQTSIKESGSYHLTEAELIFGAKSAWRNLPQSRCRIYWNKLQVFDARKVTNSRDMFEMLCKHLLYSTNKGNVRPAITVFPPRKGDGQTDFRIWNSQLIGYAGYRQPDGSVLGDPSNLAFSEVCQTLGWRSDRTRFDVLPLVLQVNGEDPEVFEIPRELVHEVELSHPELRWFVDLKLKWYSMPSYANFMLDVGGIQFPACPINEWYVASDIANNALCAPKRYDMLRMIADRLGLDVSCTDSLWKDRTLVEMNVAVIHSFQQYGVTIMDHHTSSVEFMKFFASEHEVRQGCPTDWRAVVSPLTASVTSLFHQETLNYQLMPTFTVQENPWNKAEWKSKLSSGKLSIDRIRSPGADPSRFSSRILRRALSGTFKATVLYGGFTKSEYYAKKVYETFRKAFDIRLLRMDEYDVMNLEHENLLLVVTSTHGNGEPPSNGQDFCRYLMEMSENNNNVSSIPQSPVSPRCEKFCDGNPLTEATSEGGFKLRGSGILGSLSYGVFGLGSSIYPYFCAFARGVDLMFDTLGGDRLVDMGWGDEMRGLDETFDGWLIKTFMAACEKFHIGDSASGITPNLATVAPSTDWAASKFRIYAAGIDVKSSAPVPDLCDALSHLHDRKVYPCNIISRKSLLPPESSRSTILVRLNTNGEKEMAYQPGDHVAFFPSNESAVVTRVLKRLDYQKSPDAIFKLEKLEPRETQLGTLKVWTTVSRLPTCSMRTALERFLDLTTPPTPDFLRLLATRATDPRDKEKLGILGMGSDEYEEWKSENWPNMAEVLEGYPSLKVPASLLLTQLPLLQPRYYSISSSPKQYPNEIHATVAVVSYHPNGGRGPVHYGTCSSWLYRVWKDDVIPAFVSSTPYFHLPADKSAPVILVGPGSGVAPFRSFWQDRQADLRHLASFKRELANNNDTEETDVKDRRGEGDGSDTFGDITLVYGSRNAKEDLYKGETSVAKDEGALTAVLTGYSRDPGKPRKYVQDILKDHPWLVYNVLYRRHGHIYVSGDVMMVKEVSNTIESIISQFGRLGAAEARDFVRKMKDDDRYHEEMYGLTLHVGEVMEKIRVSKKGTQVMVMNDEGPKLQPIIGRKGAALAKQQEALRQGIPGSPTMPRLRRRVTATILMRYNSLMGMDKKKTENEKPMAGVRLRKPTDDIAARRRRYEDGRRYSTGSSNRVVKA